MQSVMELIIHSLIFASFVVSIYSQVKPFKSPTPPTNQDFVVAAKCGEVRGKKVMIYTNQAESKTEEVDYVVQYLGVPYAEPPTRKLRWKKTVEKKSWEGIYDALQFGAVCPQSLDGPLPDVLLPVWYQTDNEFVRNRTSLMSEDCLYLNVYVPSAFHKQERNSRHPVQRLPVMVYFHGHTYSEGSGNFYDGSMLANLGDVVVVTFNYRLGVLGFLSMLDENTPGNYGLWDQIMVLRWIEKNIWEFGGDPRRVTVFGSGAGAASIGILMLSVHTGKEFFQRAILQSGSALSPWAIVRNPRKYAKALAGNRMIGCPTNTSLTLVDCLRATPWRNLIRVKVNPTPFDLAFGPVVDGGSHLLSDSPINLLMQGEFIKYNVIIGVSQADGFGYVRDRLRACASCSMSDKKFSYFALKALYKETNFNNDLSSFVHSFYSGSQTSLIEKIVKFLYTDWTDPTNSTLLKKSLMQVYTDRQWVDPAVKKADIHADHNHPVYFYTFSHHPGSDPDRSWIKSALGEEIPFVFGAPFFQGGYALFPYNYTLTDTMISQAVITYWTNFAKSGDPMNGKQQRTTFLVHKQNQFQNIIWQRYDVSTRPYLLISSQPGIFNHYRAEKVELWRSFLPSFTKVSKPKYYEQYLLRPPVVSINNMGKVPTLDDADDAIGPRRNNNKQVDTGDNNGMDMQLSMTLAVGFVLLFVNIIAFAIVSYHKEKDKYKIEKLQNELKMYRKKLSKKNNGVANTSKEQASTENKTKTGQLQKVTEEKSKCPSEKKYQDLQNFLQPVAKSSDLTPISHSGNGKTESNRDPFIRKFATVDRKSFPAGCSGSRPSSDQYAWSVASLVSPNQANGHAAFNEQRRGNGAVASNIDLVRGSNTGGTSSESENIYWSRSEQDEDMGTSKLNFETSCDAMPKRSSAFPSAISNTSNTYVQNHRPRCRSAMGMFSPQDGNYGLSSHYERQGSFHQRFQSDKSGVGGVDTSGAATRSIPRPRYHGSVQFLPFQSSREISPYNGSFSIPRPSTITETAPSYQKAVSQTRQENRIAPDQTRNGRSSCSNGFTSATTKL